MSDIYGLLKLNRDLLGNFALQARSIEKNVETDRILRDAARQLQAIEERMQDDGRPPEYSQQKVDAVLNKARVDAKCKNKKWTIGELRLLSYYVINLRYEPEVFAHAMQLLGANWKDMYIGGLMSFLMNAWNDCPETLLNGVREAVKTRLVNYGGSLKRYLLLKQQTDLLEKSGPARLAALLQTKGMPLKAAPTILGYKASALAFSYFSDVIINYFLRMEKVDYNHVEDILKKYPLDRTKKLLFSCLIEKADKSANTILQDQVARAARRCLGDITLATTWAPFLGATDEEKLQLAKAKAMIMAWGTRKVIEAFFEICVQDPRRRKCWLEYVPSISDFRVAGSATVRAKLLSNPELASHLRNCFIETNSRVSVTAALVLYIGNKVFVEFSDTGAMYIYNSSNQIIRNVKNKKYIDSTTNLKDTSMQMAVEQFTSWNYQKCNNEGRITHQGEWETRFRQWMREKMGIRPGQYNYSVPEPATEAKQLTLFPEEPKKANPTESTNPSRIYPASLVKNVIKGLQSKWIFKDTCRVLADLQGIYLHFRNNNRTYYLAPSDITTLIGNSIWLVPTDNSNAKFTVKLASMSKISGKTHTNTRPLGTIERSGGNIIFIPMSGAKVNVPIC